MRFRDLPERTRRVLKLSVPTTDDELWEWIKVVCGVTIPRVAVCDCHQAPFDWVADCYFDRVKNAIIMGPRGGGKTLDVAALSYAEWLHKSGVEIASIGAVLEQAKKCYRYVRVWMRDDVALGLCYPPTMKESNSVMGSRLEVITGKTIEAVNSPHPHKENVDEYELMDPDVFSEALMMATETTEHKASVRLLSTRKYATGLVQRMLDEAPERGFKVYSYCALDVAEKCTLEARPSCEPCKAIVKYDQFGQKVTWYDVCRERLRNAAGFYSIDELQSKFRSIEHEKFSTQIAPCTKPTRGDPCFTEFDEFRNSPAVIDYDPGFPVGTAWDFGLNDPTVCGVFQWNPYGEAWLIECIASGELADSAAARKWLIGDVADEILKRPYAAALKESRDHWGDPAGKQRRTYTRIDNKSAFDVLRGKGIRIRGKPKPNPARRIEALKLKIRPHPDTGEPTFFVSKRLKRVVSAFTYAQWDETKECYEHDEHSHILDMCGYFVDGKWPPASWVKGVKRGGVAVA